MGHAAQGSQTKTALGSSATLSILGKSLLQVTTLRGRPPSAGLRVESHILDSGDTLGMLERSGWNLMLCLDAAGVLGEALWAVVTFYSCVGTYREKGRVD